MAVHVVVGEVACVGRAGGADVAAGAMFAPVAEISFVKRRVHLHIGAFAMVPVILPLSEIYAFSSAN